MGEEPDFFWGLLEAGTVQTILAEQGQAATKKGGSDMDMFEPSAADHPVRHRRAIHARGPSASSASRTAGFTLTEILVATVVVAILSALASGALATARGSQRKQLTRRVIEKLDDIVAAHYASFAGRSVYIGSGVDRGAELRGYVELDLPDDWSKIKAVFRVAKKSDLTSLPADVGDTAIVLDPERNLASSEVFRLAARDPSNLENWVTASLPTGSQQTYAAIWGAAKASRLAEAVAAENSSAECLFMIVMQGGVADCLDCRSLNIDIGDRDNDGMPEFLDAWGRPIAFVLWPSGLKLPASSSAKFFSDFTPFDEVVATGGELRGGTMRPLIVSAGADGEFGLQADASPLLPGAADNITNFDAEVSR